MPSIDPAAAAAQVYRPIARRHCGTANDMPFARAYRLASMIFKQLVSPLGQSKGTRRSESRGPLNVGYLIGKPLDRSQLCNDGSCSLTLTGLSR